MGEQIQNADHGDKHVLPRIGMRKVKSILAIVIGFFIWQLIRLALPGLEVHPVFIYIYGVLEIRGSSEQTKEMSILRVKGTVIGMLVGLPMLALWIHLETRIAQQWVFSGVGLCLIVVGTLVVLLLADKLECREMTSVAAVMYLVLMVYHANEERYVYTIVRALQMVIGIFLAYLLNVKLLPYPGKSATEDPPKEAD